jgi:tetratricopeptide (TPR) repeat protein
MQIDDLRREIDGHFEKEEYLEALESCIALLDEHRPHVTFDDVFKKGLCHFKLEEDAEAIGCFNKALELQPGNVMALTNKGICLFNLGKVREAFQIFNLAIKLNPNVFPPWHYMGFYYLALFMKTGDQSVMQKTVNCYRRVVSMAPDFGGFTMHDPIKDMDYSIDLFLTLHDDVPELPVDTLTTV